MPVYGTLFPGLRREHRDARSTMTLIFHVHALIKQNYTIVNGNPPVHSAVKWGNTSGQALGTWHVFITGSCTVHPYFGGNHCGLTPVAPLEMLRRVVSHNELKLSAWFDYSPRHLRRWNGTAQPKSWYSDADTEHAYMDTQCRTTHHRQYESPMMRQNPGDAQHNLFTTITACVGTALDPLQVVSCSSSLQLQPSAQPSLRTDTTRACYLPQACPSGPSA